MKIKKIIIDILMIINLILAMGYSQTGETNHEILGICFCFLFLIHNFLNINWYKTIFKGEYNLFRIVLTILNLVLILDFLLIIISGLMMTDLPFLSHLNLSSIARTIHLSTSYLGFVLMPIHLGFNWNMIKNKMPKFLFKKIIFILINIISIAGFILFIKLKIIFYIFLKIKFVFFDYDEKFIVFLAKYLTMMICFTNFGYTMTKYLQGVKNKVR